MPLNLLVIFPFEKDLVFVFQGEPFKKMIWKKGVQKLNQAKMSTIKFLTK